jgi:hypothetical protein
MFGTLNILTLLVVFVNILVLAVEDLPECAALGVVCDTAVIYGLFVG